jgi:hypothetical protein
MAPSSLSTRSASARAGGDARLERLDAGGQVALGRLRPERRRLQRGPLLAELRQADPRLGESVRQLLDPHLKVGDVAGQAQLLALVPVAALERRGLEQGHLGLVLVDLAEPLLEVELLGVEPGGPLAQPLDLGARRAEVLLADRDRQVAVVGLVAQALERPRDLPELVLGRHVPRRRVGQVALEPGRDLLELADLPLLGQDARALGVARAARHHAARVHHVAVERHQRLLDAAPVERDGALERVHHQRVAEQRRPEIAVAVLEAHQIAHGAEHALTAGQPPARAILEPEGALGGRPVRHEGRAARAGLLEILDRAGADLVRLDQDTAQAVAERRLDRHLELLRRVDLIRHQPAHPVAELRVRAPRGLHDRAGAALEALVAVVDLAQRDQTRSPPVQLGPQRLDLRLARSLRLLEERAPPLELLGPVAEVHAGLPELGQIVAQPADLRLELGRPAVHRRGLLHHLPVAPRGVVAPPRQRLALALGTRQIGPGVRQQPPRLVELALGPRQLLARRRGLRLARSHLGLTARHLGAGAGQRCRLRLGLHRQLAAPLGQPADLRLPGAGALVELTRLAALVGDLAVGQLDAVVAVVDLFLQRREPPLLDGQLGPLRHQAAVARLELGPDQLMSGRRLLERRPVRLVLGQELEPAVRRRPQLDVAHLGLVAAVALRLLRLPPERAEPLLQLRHDVGHPEQILPGLLELALGRLLLELELGDAGGLFDDVPAVLRAGRHDLPDAALLDDRVGLGADSGAQEEVGDVAQAAGHLVEEVVRRPVAEQPPRDGDLAVLGEVDGRRGVRQELLRLAGRRVDVDILGRRGRIALGALLDADRLGVGGELGLLVERQLQRLVREADVLERERHLRHAGGPAGVRPVEDDIAHGVAAQVLGGLLAHAPADGVDDVGLAAPVRPHDGGDRLREVHHGAVAERLEADDLDPLYAHSKNLSLVSLHLAGRNSPSRLHPDRPSGHSGRPG